jgi:hypothetical protein
MIKQEILLIDLNALEEDCHHVLYCDIHSNDLIVIGPARLIKRHNELEG